MGTPDFAVASLDELVQAGWNIVGVVTAADKPAGRGMKLTQSAVKTYALQQGLPVLQPEKLKHPDFIEALRSLHADLQVVVAFRMLPEVVWNMPPMGTINLHGSLLPQYRGAAPINWAIINGETYTGVTTFKLQHQIDTGDILLNERIAIGADATAGELHDTMKVIGARLLVKTVQGLFAGTLTEKPQDAIDAGALKHAPKLFTENCTINWQQTALSIHNSIRGLSPFPGALTTLNGKLLKVFKSRYELMMHNVPCGQVESDQKTFIRFAAAGGFVYLLDLQPEGKKRMQVEDYLRGNKVITSSGE